MSSGSTAERQRLLELLSDRALFGLSQDEASELARLKSQHSDIADDDIDVIVGLLESSAEMPVDQLQATKLKKQVLSHLRPSADGLAIGRPATELGAPPSQTVARKTDRWSRRLFWIALTTAAALLVANIFDFGASKTMTVAQQRDQLLASATDVLRVDWQATDQQNNYGGDVVWSNTQQRGFMVFVGLPANNPSQEQYQLWIFDSRQDERYPIDGGVFDIVAQQTGDSNIVPIHAKIVVFEPTMFAVTVEKPGGVVVSDRSRLPVVAPIK